MLAPVTTRIEVPCGARRAFDVFIGGMGAWWPLQKRAMSMRTGKPALRLEVDARVGGRIVEIGGDGTQYHWGTIRTLEPPGYLALDFHMGMPASQASLVEVRFASLASDRTEVTLTQSNWEAFGDLAEMLQGSYGSSWSMILEGFERACSDTPK